MDPLTQAALGAAAPQALIAANYAKPASLRHIGIVGALAGMAPDLDVFIRSSTDPLLALEYHRQFTHSLAFIPLGAALCALALWPFFHKSMSLKLLGLICLIGYGTHGLLDACTTYGTLLLWPFSDARIAWNTISVVDPLFTVPLLIGVIIAAKRHSARAARMGIAWAVFYLGLGGLQAQRAVNAGEDLAASRGHIDAVVSAKPGFGNVILWKTIYTHNDHFWVDAVRLTRTAETITGDSIPRLNLSEAFPWLNTTSQQARDIDRFRWFSNDHLAVDRNDPNLIVDMRYSHLPNAIEGLWGIRLSETAGDEDHVLWVVNRSPTQGRVRQLWTMLMGEQ